MILRTEMIYWREASSGHSRSAYYTGKVVSTFFRMSLSSLHFTVFYTLLSTPLIPFGMLYAANLLYFFCIYGLAACVSVIARREDGPLLAMIVSLIIGVFGGYGPPLSTIKMWHLEWFWRICPGVMILSSPRNEAVLTSRIDLVFRGIFRSAHQKAGVPLRLATSCGVDRLHDQSLRPGLLVSVCLIFPLLNSKID